MNQNSIIHLRSTKNKIYAELKQNKEHFQNFAKHSHSTFSLCMIGEGEIGITYHPDTKVTLYPRQIALFHPDQVHQTYNHTDTALSYYNLHMDSTWALSIQQRYFRTEILLPMKALIISENDYAERLMKIITEINLGSLTEREIERRISILLEDLFFHYTDEQNTKNDKNEELLFEQIKHYILEHIDQEISAATIAAHTGYSTAHVSRRFKQHFGLTLQAFLIDQRIHHAKALMLQHHDLSLAQIALEAGFYDQSHFIKNFKKAYSISPHAYKT